MDNKQTNDAVYRLLQASIPHEQNKRKLIQMRSGLNTQEDIALQIVDLKKELMRYRTALTEIRFADDLQTAVEVADKALK